MSAEKTIEFTEDPKLLPLYRNIFLKKRAGLKKGESLPALAAHRASATVNPAKLSEYRKACGFDEDGKLPLLYPHVLTSSMHISIIAHDDFPLSPFGAVHLRDHILQHRPINPDEVMDYSCRLCGQRVAKGGLEFDISTLILIGEARVWESISTYMVRGKKWGEPGEAAPLAAMPALDNPAPEAEAHWHVPANMGKRYAKITGDYNPIHVSKVLAKLFGFKRDIIHGFQVAARCLTNLPDLPQAGKVRCDLIFKGPVFLDSDVTMKAECSETRRRFDLYCAKNDRPSVIGEIRAAAADEENLVN
jgi:acyl dehydratase